MTRKDEKKTPGRKEGWRKETAMTGKVAIRIPQELEDWLQAEGDKRYLDIGAMARMLLKEKMDAAKSKAASEVDDGKK